jgi:hypothetical protein
MFMIPILEFSIIIFVIIIASLLGYAITPTIIRGIKKYFQSAGMHEQEAEKFDNTGEKNGSGKD